MWVTHVGHACVIYMELSFIQNWAHQVIFTAHTHTSHHSITNTVEFYRFLSSCPDSRHLLKVALGDHALALRNEVEIGFVPSPMANGVCDQVAGLVGPRFTVVGRLPD